MNFTQNELYLLSEGILSLMRDDGEKEENMTAFVIEDDYGVTHCENCGAEILCDDCGDMPDYCPDCGAELDYNDYREEIKCIYKERTEEL